ncbi:hypothetical protein [Zooshikella ganghwensis]|uniref:Chalcone isomerase domain-containing protein n=1 Tax=Zooshikella ganghwensis TaxID=202772 RepID=A0A4V1INI0_9GAMM|nr:hypothetical protein [Zooshikella ganghwensis]RDH43801.1 hypothetical protein B9G39_10295 [Zooshikella ganghwensis]
MKKVNRFLSLLISLGLAISAKAEPVQIDLGKRIIDCYQITMYLWLPEFFKMKGYVIDERGEVYQYFTENYWEFVTAENIKDGRSISTPVLKNKFKKVERAGYIDFAVLVKYKKLMEQGIKGKYSFEGQVIYDAPPAGCVVYERVGDESDRYEEIVLKMTGGMPINNDSTAVKVLISWLKSMDIYHSIENDS